MEFVDLIARLVIEEFGQPLVALQQYVHREVLGSAHHPEGVAAFGETDEKSRGPHTDLGGETDQTTRWLTIGLGCHHEHRVVQHLHQLIKRFIVHINIMDVHGVLGPFFA